MNKVFWSQVFVLLDAQLKVRYRKTIGGFVWVLMNPLIQFGSQAVIFSLVLKLDIENYPQFLMFGMLPWLYSFQTLEMNTGVFVQQSLFLKSYSTDPRVFIVATTFENALNSAATFLVMFLAFQVFSSISWHQLWLYPVSMIPLIAGIASLSQILAILQTFLRDTRYMVSFALSVGYFLTPIFYPPDRLPDWLQSGLWANPFWIWIRPFRSNLNGLELGSFALDWVASMALSAGLTLIAVLYWARVKNEVRLRA
ncbi:MAG: ABC transporter permease [Bdellovibrionales bacterium]|nr:ABC transporter permease [Bdellovibrionales bacterium]